jgi:hypothetical protein
MILNHIPKFFNVFRTPLTTFLLVLVVTLEVVVVLDVVPLVDGVTILMRLFVGGSYDPPIELNIISF